MLDFNALIPVLEKMDLNMTFQLKEGKITFSVIPKKLDGKNIDIKPLVGSGTAEEMNIGFMDVFNKAITMNIGLITNIDEVEKSVKGWKPKASTASSSSTSGKTTSAPKAPDPTFATSKPPSGNKTEVQVYDKIKGIFKQAKERMLKEGNLDLFNYYLKQASELAPKIKSNKNMTALVTKEMEMIKKEIMTELKIEEKDVISPEVNPGELPMATPPEEKAVTPESVVPPPVEEESPFKDNLPNEVKPGTVAAKTGDAPKTRSKRSDAGIKKGSVAKTVTDLKAKGTAAPTMEDVNKARGQQLANQEEEVSQPHIEQQEEEELEVTHGSDVETDDEIIEQDDDLQEEEEEEETTPTDTSGDVDIW